MWRPPAQWRKVADQLRPKLARLVKALAALRNGEFAKSIKTIAEIRDERGENKAADRKVRLQACHALLGEGIGEADVTVNVGLGQSVTPGYVIMLGDEPQGPVIEGRAETEDGGKDGSQK